MLVLRPDGERDLYDFARGTVVSEGDVRPVGDVALPPNIAARLR